MIFHSLCVLEADRKNLYIHPHRWLSVLCTQHFSSNLKSKFLDDDGQGSISIDLQIKLFKLKQFLIDIKYITTLIVFVGTHFVHRVDGISYSSIKVGSLVSAEASRREGFDARNVFRPCFRENLTKMIKIQKLAYENLSLDKYNP